MTQDPDPDHEQDSKRRGVRASSAEFARYDQVEKPDYHLAEAAEAFGDAFEFRTCDLGRFLRGDAADRRAFADELGEAMRQIGFEILVGHGVDERLFEEPPSWIEELFVGSTLDEKLAHRAARHGAVSEGYFPLEETSDIHPDQV